MSFKTVNKGSLGCAVGIAIMTGSTLLGGIVLLKCFGLAYAQKEYTIAQYISAIFTRDALFMYCLAGVFFSIGLWIAINSMITILKSFFEI